MPLSCDPEANAEFVLEPDRKLDPDKQPTFILRFCSVRQWRKLMTLFNRINDKAVSDEDRYKDTAEFLGIVVVGWRNMGREFSIDNLLDALTPTETWELIYGVLSAIQLGEAERRGFSLPSRDNGSASAPAAATASVANS